jgi:hypothetical protein
MRVVAITTCHDMLMRLERTKNGREMVVISTCPSKKIKHAQQRERKREEEMRKHFKGKTQT